jgi:stearoyl-CoA desaturase (delta-9 desaturase)
VRRAASRSALIHYGSEIAMPDSPAIPASAPVLGTVRPRTSRISQVVTLIAVVVPPLGTLAAMGVLWNVAFHWSDLLVMTVLYVVCAFGTTIGFHRYFTHKGFKTGPEVKATLAILGCMTVQGPLTQWVTDHRKHHALSDREGDPHSPQVGHGDGALGSVMGFVHAHVGWMFSNLGMEQGLVYGKDLYEDRMIRAIDRLYLLWVVATLGIPFAIGYAIGGLDRGVELLLWGGLVRVFLYQHATFSVNSICHMFGRQDYRSRDESRNNWLVALLVFGEGWHNNHHAFPASARHGLHRFQLDLSWWVIRGLERLGLVWDVKVPDQESLHRRRLQPANRSG